MKILDIKKGFYDKLTWEQKDQLAFYLSILLLVVWGLLVLLF